MYTDQHTSIAKRTGQRRLMAAATLAVTAFAAPAQAQDMGKGMTAVQLLKRGLDTFLAKDMKGWADLCDENVVAEFPFSPDPATRKLVGRAAVYAYIKDYPKAIDIKAIPTLKIHATDDPNVAIAEWSVSGRVISNGNPYELSCATVVTFRNGLMANYREYWNPQAFTAAMAGTRF
ncbi:nuclear transport factor 2 family protein [Ideonella sp. A 288]|uniref:nuclear transport factor 2 family protein n=1 Tax=Ideonella sp. A 288 TaxID=1962181 RepID=UPI0018FE4201|nr:nuclear transport factor 2 family protein [Ideonella sp. A 288]